MARRCRKDFRKAGGLKLKPYYPSEKLLQPWEPQAGQILADGTERAGALLPPSAPQPQPWLCPQEKPLAASPEPQDAAVMAELVYTGHFPPCCCSAPSLPVPAAVPNAELPAWGHRHHHHHHQTLAARPWRHLLQARRSPLPDPSPSPGQRRCPCPRLALCPPLSPACPLPAPDTPGLLPRWPGIIAQWKDAPSIDLQSNLIGLWRIVFTPSRA